MLSTHHRFLFIHVPEAAGLSVTAALEQAAYGNARRFVASLARRLGRASAWQLSWPLGMFNVYPPHRTAGEWSQKLSSRTFAGLFKFAVVRNPWDWQVSLYRNILQNPSHHQHALLRSLGSFGQYLEWRVTAEPELQKSYLTDATGRFLVNFVGRYERLASDFQHVCRVLNLLASLPNVEEPPLQDYRSYYNARGRKLVEEHFQEDIAAFGYTFDAERSKSGGETWRSHEATAPFSTDNFRAASL